LERALRDNCGLGGRLVDGAAEEGGEETDAREGDFCDLEGR